MTSFGIRRQRRTPTLLLVVALFLLQLIIQVAASSSSSPSTPSPTRANGMVLRIRLGDGSMEKVQIKPGAEDETTLDQVLSQLSIADDASIQIGGETIEPSNSKSVSELGLKHGSIVTVVPPKSEAIGDQPDGAPKESRFAKLKHESNLWNPYPELAKDYEHALLQTKTKRSAQKGMSYNAIAKLRSSLHVVDPQPEGPLKRMYMCQHAAGRFQANGIPKSGSSVVPRFGLLLGTVQRERVDMGRPRKARTSLSSQTSESEFCTVAKVQAVWEPSGQKSAKYYDCASAEEMLESESGQRVLKVAERLGLAPVGWIFTYLEDRHGDEDALPMYGADVNTGARLQISNMKRHKERLDGAKFVTLAMDGKTGATEAFQLSNVGVQMVAEGVLSSSTSSSPAASESLKQRHVDTRHEIIVDGQETTKLDSVLCLVNTAMLSHVGAFSGSSAASTVKKNGGLMTKKKKAILKAMDDDDVYDRKLLEELCDFNVLLAFDSSLADDDDSQELCAAVRKWSRGQKSGTKLADTLKAKLRNIIES